MAKKGGGGEPDELEVLKGTLLARELEVFTIKDKMHRLEDRSQLMERTMEHLSASLGEKISMLTDINNYLKRHGEKSYSHCFTRPISMGHLHLATKFL
jgi:hypothetical protein